MSMMRAIVIATAALIVGSDVIAFAAGNGKVRQYNWVNGVSPNALSASTPLVTTSLAKGLKHNTLNINATIDVSYTPKSAPNSLEGFVKVNGFGYPDILPYVYTGATCTPLGDGTGSYAGCHLSHTWWLDLDVAEAAHPGAFIGQPIVVELGAYWDAAPPTGGNVTAGLTVELKKNK